MAVHAVAILLFLMALRKRLVFEHIGVAPLFPVINGEGVPRPHALQTGIHFYLAACCHHPRVRTIWSMPDGLAASETGTFHVHGTFILVILHGEVHAPLGGVHRIIGYLHHAHEWVFGLLLALKDVDQQGGNPYSRGGGDQPRNDHYGNNRAPGPCRSSIRHIPR